jgi:hypothetical protein
MVANRFLAEFMARIRAHPIAAVFESIESISRDYGDQLSSVVKSPIDLRTIDSRITANEYTSITGFFDDLEQISRDTIIAFGQGTEYAAAADFLREIVRKEQRTFHHLSTKNWTSEMFRLKNATGELLSSGVPSLARFPSDIDIRRFLNATSKLTSSQEIQDLTDIIAIRQPELVDTRKPSLVINLTALRPETLNDLFEYIRRKSLDDRF